MKIGSLFRVVKGGGPNHLRVGQLWEITDSKYLGAQFTKDAKRNGIKSGSSTMILNGFAVAQRELRAGRIVYADVNAQPPVDKRTSALLEAGEVMDGVMMQFTTCGVVSLLDDAQLVDKVHRALNSVVAVTGTPWRK